MKQPLNAAAREIVRLRTVNENLEIEMHSLRLQQMENSELIGNFSHVAEWEEVQDGEDPGAASGDHAEDPEPEPEPVVEDPPPTDEPEEPNPAD